MENPEIFTCPENHAIEQKVGEIKDGKIRCEACGKDYGVRKADLVLERI
jgi:hypothetical protein